MENLTLSLEDNPDPLDIQTVIRKILEYNNNSQFNKDVTNLLSVFIRYALLLSYFIFTCLYLC